MQWIYGVVFLIVTGQFAFGADENVTVKEDNINICETCKCNAKENFMNCGQLNLFKLFDANDWTAVNSSNNVAALINIEFNENGIEVVTRFPKMNVHSLSFRHNKIRKIEAKAFYNLTTLEMLDLSDNRLTNQALQKEVFEGPYSADQYEPMKNLKWLNLGSNEIHALSADVFDHLNNLETLLLSRNPFKIIDPNSASAISSLTKLKVLDLGFMELRTLPEHMLHAPRSLHTLNLTGNLFQVLPEALHFAVNLVHLNLDDNPFARIGGENSFPVLPKLETLNLSYSHTLKIIDDAAFQNLSALQHFDCRGNRHLSSIHPHAFANPKSELHVQWPPIRSMILYNNNLSSISEQLIEHWIDLEEIDIRYNPWKCSCENQWMVDKLIPIIKQKETNNPAMFEDLKCETPIEMKAKKLVDISAKGVHMRCEDYYGRRPERDAPILVGVFIGLMIGIPLTLAILLVYRRGCFGYFGYRPSPADYGRAFYKRTELREDLHI